MSNDSSQRRLQGGRVERLDDVIADTGLLRRDHVLCLALGRDHDEGQLLQLGVRTNFGEKLHAAHRLHVPVGDDQRVFLVAQLLQRRAAVGGFIDVVEAELLQQVADNPQHRSEEHTSELQSLMRISYAVFCLKKKKIK